MKYPKAKSCPFCSVEPYIQPWHGGGPEKTRVGCDNDPGCDVLPSVTGETQLEAIKLWNIRK